MQWRVDTAGVALGVVAVELELGEGGVVGLDRGVRWLEGEEAHGDLVQCTLSRGYGLADESDMLRGWWERAKQGWITAAGNGRL